MSIFNLLSIQNMLTSVLIWNILAIYVAGVSGIHLPKAVKKMRGSIDHAGDVMEDAIPALRCMNRNIISFYAGELAEGLVEAAGVGKGVEIAIGYPKILVFKVN